MTLSATELGAILADLRPVGIEIHCGVDPDLPKKYGAAIKAAGGTYGHARGYATKRIVWLPSKAGELIDSLVRDFGGYGKRTVTMIVRQLAENGFSSSDFPTVAAVHYIPKDAPSPLGLLLERFVLAMIKLREQRDSSRRGVAITNTEIIENSQCQLDEQLRRDAHALEEAANAVKRLRKAFEAGMTDEQLIAAAAKDNGSTFAWRINLVLDHVEGKEQ